MLQQSHGAAEAFEDLPRYNAAPTQHLPVFAVRDGRLTAQTMRWWLTPHWSKEDSLSFSSFNARAESLTKSKLFAPYFKGSRCLIPADAFYEWKAASRSDEKGGKKSAQKIPYCIRMKSKEPFLFAGLFSVRKKEDGTEQASFAIITGPPNELISSLHNRMPVILRERDFERWLDREYTDTATLSELLVPYTARAMELYPVSTKMNSSRYDGPDCLAPVEE